MENLLTDRRSLASRVMLFVFCLAGVIGPIAALLHFAISDITLRWFGICAAVTCATLLPFLWNGFFRRAGPPERWDEERWKRWDRLYPVLNWLLAALPFLCLALGWFYRQRHPGQIILGVTISFPLTLTLVWRLMIGAYIRTRAPLRVVEEFEAFEDYKHSPPLEDLQPIQSQHWGEAPRRSLL